MYQILVVACGGGTLCSLKEFKNLMDTEKLLMCPELCQLIYKTEPSQESVETVLTLYLCVQHSLHEKRLAVVSLVSGHIRKYIPHELIISYSSLCKCDH